MLLTDIDSKLYSSIQTALFDTFAYRLGPDEWEKAEEEFRQSLQNAVASQQADSADPEYSGTLSVGQCDHGILYSNPCSQCGR